MFICTVCSKPSRPREKPMTVPTYRTDGSIAHEERQHSLCVARHEHVEVQQRIKTVSPTDVVTKARARVRLGMTADAWRRLA